jgi:energy-coupling factor transport system ATP-binding protein
VETFKIEHLTFTYPGKPQPALKDICLGIEQGQFVTICGESGCGKTTLLRLLKSVLAPHGAKEGKILFEDVPLEFLDHKSQSEKIGFVLQSPDNQIVTDKVWHELAFGLESLGYKTQEIRTRVAEMSSFFGIQEWFHKSVSELSGGQKQLLNLAAILTMQPSVLILDEPTSQLDPIAANDFLKAIEKINRELGMTIILTEHRLEEALPISDRVIVIDNGCVIADGTPKVVGERLRELRHRMFLAMPAPMRVYAGIDNDFECPVTVREGRGWLKKIAGERTLHETAMPDDPLEVYTNEPIIELKEVWFKYEKNLPDVVKGLTLRIYPKRLFAIVGGNGTGKTTGLSIIAGILKPYRGTVKICGRALSDISDAEKYNGLLGILPQNPQALFVKKTVELDLFEMFAGRKVSKDEQHYLVATVSRLCELDGLLSMHPYDLSGGEQQRAAIAKVLLLRPSILLLDEPTKGLDAYMKEKLAAILKSLTASGVTVVMVSHDIEFCARHADHCGMFFDGSIVSEDTPRRFFSGKTFYTTAANRMARNLLPKAILAEDIISALGGKVHKSTIMHAMDEKDLFIPRKNVGKHKPSVKREMPTGKRIVMAGVCLLLFILTDVFLSGRWSNEGEYLVNLALVLELGGGIWAILPQNAVGMRDTSLCHTREKHKLPRRTLVATAMILIAIPLTIYVGIYFLGDRKYYFISQVILLETMLPFVLVFERRKPQARELIVVSVLCALGVAGRAAFFMLPQFKPVVTMVIISGVCFGGETGFLVGAVTGFVSNMFFGQGPWTPWQMFAFGIIGFLAGILFRKGLLLKERSSMCIFGGFATFLIYGGIMNTASVIMWQAKPTTNMFISAYLMGIPFDLIHALATVFFLWVISAPMIEKLDRIKLKYGLIE